MSRNRIIAGIELGSSKISTIIAQLQSDQVTFEKKISIVGVSSVESHGVRKGQIVNIEEAVEAVIESVEAAERMAGYNLDSAYLAVGGGNINSQNSRGVVAVSRPDEEITVDDIDRVIEAASAINLPSSREVLHVIPRDFSVDGDSGVKDPIGMSGVRLEVETHVVTASAASVRNIRKAITEVGINIENMIFTGVAASEAVLSNTEKELGCVVVDIGGGTTSVAAFIDGSLAYSSVIPIGAKNVTNDLAIGLRVSLESAEKIKLYLSADTDKKSEDEDSDQIDLDKLGLKEIKNVSRKTLVEGIIRPRLNEIFTMVRLDLEKAGLATSIPSGAIVTGGGAETVGVIDSAKRMLSLPVRIGVPQGVTGLVDDVLSPAYAVPIGLIIFGSKEDAHDAGMPFAKKLRIPSKGLLGNFVEKFKELLP